MRIEPPVFEDRFSLLLAYDGEVRTAVKENLILSSVLIDYKLGEVRECH